MDWHKGPPPRTPGVWYVVRDAWGELVMVVPSTHIETA